MSSEPDVILITVVAPARATSTPSAPPVTSGPVISLEGSVGLSFFPQDDPNLYVMSVYRFPDPDSDDPAVRGVRRGAGHPRGGPVDVRLVQRRRDRAGVPRPRRRSATPSSGAVDCLPGTDLKEQLDETALDFGEIVPSFEYTADDHYPYTNWFLYEVGPDFGRAGRHGFELEE